MKIAALCILLSVNSYAQLSPEITSWVLNSSGAKGYGGIESNVQKVQYSENFVYISATCIPGYDIGPWQGNPNTPVNQNFVYKITRHPQKNNGTLTVTGLGHIGVWSNGVSIFNSKDGRSYNNQGVWNQDALVSEGSTFDNCLGHPAPNGEYHHHINPRCLYDDKDSSKHSPIIGYAFDGFPVYGAYGYANADGTGNVTRMRSSYRLRSITDRTTLPNGTQLQSSQYGPAITPQVPLGTYIEDYEYVDGLGDLDEHNGRWCITPDYPLGTYAYFVTLNDSQEPAYPYTLGSTYYGVVTAGNTGPNGGHNTITEQVTSYDPSADVESISTSCSVQLFPNPASNTISVMLDNTVPNNSTLDIFAPNGIRVIRQEHIQPAVQYAFDVSTLASGTYMVIVSDRQIVVSSQLLIVR